MTELSRTEPDMVLATRGAYDAVDYIVNAPDNVLRDLPRDLNGGIAHEVVGAAEATLRDKMTEEQAKWFTMGVAAQARATGFYEKHS